jgi:hypothetical protein
VQRKLDRAAASPASFVNHRGGNLNANMLREAYLQQQQQQQPPPPSQVQDVVLPGMPSVAGVVGATAATGGFIERYLPEWFNWKWGVLIGIGLLFVYIILRYWGMIRALGFTYGVSAALPFLRGIMSAINGVPSEQMAAEIEAFENGTHPVQRPSHLPVPIPGYFPSEGAPRGGVLQPAQPQAPPHESEGEGDGKEPHRGVRFADEKEKDAAESSSDDDDEVDETKPKKKKEGSDSSEEEEDEKKKGDDDDDEEEDGEKPMTHAELLDALTAEAVNYAKNIRNPQPEVYEEEEIADYDGEEEEEEEEEATEETAAAAAAQEE